MMALRTDENVIVIDDSSGDEEGEKPSAESKNTNPVEVLPPAQQSDRGDDDDDDVIMIEPDIQKSTPSTAAGALKSLTSEITVSKVPINDPPPIKVSSEVSVSKISTELSVSKVSPEVSLSKVPTEVTVSEVIDVDTIDDSDTLDFSELRAALDSANTEQYKNRKGRGPVCCNSWCDHPATTIPEEHVRDYYNIPSGSTFKLCHDCVTAYYDYMSIAEKNLERNGDMLEGRCNRFNEFIILEDDSDEEDDAVDPELEKLLGKAIEESLKVLDEEYNFQKTFDTTREKLIEKLDKFTSDGAQLAQDIHGIELDLFESSERFKNEFRPNILELTALDIPLDISGGQAHKMLGVEDVMTETCEPDDLPPYGELHQPPPKIGDSFYVMKEYQTAEWIPFKIADIMSETNEYGVSVESYTVETMVNGFMYRRIVNGDQIAYSNVPDVRLGIGSRVLGVFNHNGDRKNTRLFLSGMIAELPTPLNNFRYLVFFDDGKVQYCPHEDLRAVYQCSKKIHEYFSGFNVEFVQSYLNKFPERAMVKTNPDHFVRVELNGFWISGKVDMLDGSLARVTFNIDHRSEWIYRGSPRLRPVFEKIQADLRNPLTKALPVIKNLPPRTMGPKSKRNGNVDLSNLHIVIDSSDDEEENKQARAVAKKSTSRPVQAPAPRFSQLIHRRPEKRVTRSSVIRRMPPILLTPNAFRWHKCSFACVTWVKYSEDKTKGINPLAIPSIFAFKRDIDVTSAVTYTAPCGKRLKNIQEVLKYLSETLIPLTLDMFDFDIRTQIFDEFIVAPQYVLIEDISYGEERNPIPCVNDVDNQCPDLMNYMIVRRPMEGVHINLEPGFLVCCDCPDNCRDRSKCRCWRLTIDNFKPFNVGEGKRHVTKIGYQYQRLDQNILSGVYECNSQCKCNTVTCINRVVQHPTRHKLQLFKTPKKGWGTRCVNDIPQGVFICTYVGNILTEPKANETGTINGDEYFAELDHIEVMEASKADFEREAPDMTDEEDEESAEEMPEPQPRGPAKRAIRSCTLRKRKTNTSAPPKPAKPARLEQESDSDSDAEDDSVRKMYGPNETVYVMDAKIAGNIGRYFNHSCDPNIFVQNVYVDTHDLRFPWVAFFALRHIPAGAELTWDYGYKIGSVPGKVLYCYCGSSNCRKRLL